jgi:molecular chaperone DnaK (HSP70)
MSTNAARSWTLAIDFGTSFTAAAVAENGRVDALDINGKRRIPSVVFLNEDGTLAVGESALNRAALAPERVERTPKAYLDGGEPEIILGDQPLKVTTLVGRIYHEVLQEALRQHNGTPPERVILTHPATWSQARLDLLVAAAKEGGINEPVLMSEPEAAALHLSSTRSGGQPVPEGGCVLVYDLGGGTFDTAALRRTGDRFELIGKPGGDDQVGGVLFDDLLYRKLGETAFESDEWKAMSESDEREWRRANFHFRDQVREAKEEVSQAPHYGFYVPAPIGRDVQVTREQVEDLIREHIHRTLDLLEETLKGAGLEKSELEALYLVGGSSRVPMVAHEVRSRFGRADTKGEPKAVVALGAAGRDAVTEPAPEPAGGPVTTKGEDWKRRVSRRGGKAIAALASVLALGGGVVALAAAGDPSPTPTSSSSPTPPPTSPDNNSGADADDSSDDDLIGTWSGTVTDDYDESTSESVTITVNSFDGWGDGTLETQLGSVYCSSDLAWVRTDGAAEIFETSPDGDCFPSIVSLEYDSSDDSVWFAEQWEQDGQTVSYSGFIERG